MAGKIPKKIQYTFNKSTSCRVTVSDDSNNLLIDKTYLPVMVSDLCGAKRHNQIEAAKWSSNCDISKVEGIINKLDIVKVEFPEYQPRVMTTTLANVPFEIRVVDFSWYDKTGRYKVVTDHDLYADIRAPILIDTIMNCGVDKGGKIPAKFVWGRINNGSLQLIRVGSRVYNSIKDYMKRSTMVPVSVRNLVIGGIYRGKKQRDRIFIGCVDTGSTEDSPRPMLLWFHLDKANGSPELQLANYLKISEFSEDLPPCYNFTTMSTPKLVFTGRGPKLFSEDLHYPWDRLALTVSNSSIERCGEITLPSGLIESLQSNMISIMRSHVDYASESMKEMVMYASDKQAARQRLLVYYKEKCHMRKPGARIPDILEYSSEYRILDNFNQS